VVRAESIVGEEVDKFGAWLRSRGAIPTVVALRQRFDAVRRAELDRLTSTLPPEMRERVDDITRLVVEKLLLTPTEQLKSLSDADTVGAYSEALTRLFGLSQPQTPVSEPDAEDPAPQTRTDRTNRRVEPFVRSQKR
jgi:glutamyl-tRNA reductase